MLMIFLQPQLSQLVRAISSDHDAFSRKEEMDAFSCRKQGVDEAITLDFLTTYHVKYGGSVCANGSAIA